LRLSKKQRKRGLDTEAYDEITEKGLTPEQHSVAEKYAGDGRIQLTGVRSKEDRNATVPRLIDKLAEGKKLPWMFTLDGVRFAVKTSVGSGGNSHSKWHWQEDGYKFVFYNPKRDDCVHNIEISN